ncbi:MAG: hypothetical protein JEZ12_14555 [Desulfobacterium sp.]|nr:hypothetical protein [Desulfobacterium sp.]
MNKEQYEIRNATIRDVLDISELSGELGYSTSEFEIKERLSSMLNAKDHVVYVAFVSSGKVIGWIHVYESKRVQSGRY